MKSSQQDPCSNTHNGWSDPSSEHNVRTSQCPQSFYRNLEALADLAAGFRAEQDAGDPDDRNGECAARQDDLATHRATEGAQRAPVAVRARLVRSSAEQEAAAEPRKEACNVQQTSVPVSRKAHARRPRCSSSSSSGYSHVGRSWTKQSQTPELHTPILRCRPRFWYCWPGCWLYCT